MRMNVKLPRCFIVPSMEGRIVTFLYTRTRIFSNSSEFHDSIG